jgi:hypothetical protein
VVDSAAKLLLAELMKHLWLLVQGVPEGLKYQSKLFEKLKN